MPKITVSCSIDGVDSAEKVQISLDGNVMGTSEPLDAADKEGTLFHWNNAAAWDDQPDASELTVQFMDADDAVVASHTLEYASLTEKKVVAAALVEGIVAVQWESQPDTVPADASLRLHVSARNLTNTERGLGFIRKSDPYFELRVVESNEILYKSETLNNELDPNWKAATVTDLKEMPLSTEVILAIYDQDKDGQRDEMGESPTLTLEDLLVTPRLSVSKGGIILLRQASLMHGDAVDDSDAGALATATKAVAAQQQLEAAQAAVVTAQEAADAQAATLAEATAAQEAAQAAVTEWTDRSAAAAEHSSGVAGQFELKIRCKDLPNTDGFFNRSDPFFELYSVNGTSMYESEIVDDNLFPVWKAVTLDLAELTEGDLESPLRITISDKDGGDNKTYIGEVQQSVNALIQAADDDTAFPLIATGKDGGLGKLHIQKAALVDYVDWKTEGELCATELETATAALEEATAAVEAASGDEAAQALEAAQAAVGELEAAAAEATAALESMMAALSME